MLSCSPTEDKLNPKALKFYPQKRRKGKVLGAFVDGVAHWTLPIRYLLPNYTSRALL
jgi:hypothetical protein